jgi:hypothetical protein
LVLGLVLGLGQQRLLLLWNIWLLLVVVAVPSVAVAVVGIELLIHLP